MDQPCTEREGNHEPTGTQPDSTTQGGRPAFDWREFQVRLIGEIAHAGSPTSS